MTQPDVLKVNEPQVACEVIEGDIVLVHFESGLYYSVRGTGADVCFQVLAGVSVPQISASIAKHYGVSTEQVGKDVANFLKELLDAGLLARADGQAEKNYTGAFAGKSYTPPRFEKFDDMADQLLLDKIDDESKDATWQAAPAAGEKKT